MTLQPLLSGFPHIWGKFCSFLSVHGWKLVKVYSANTESPYNHAATPLNSKCRDDLSLIPLQLSLGVYKNRHELWAKWSPLPTSGFEAQYSKYKCLFWLPKRLLHGSDFICYPIYYSFCGSAAKECMKIRHK